MSATTPLLTYVTDTRVVDGERLLARLDRFRREAPDLTPRVAVQVRDLGRSGRELATTARDLARGARALGCRLVVNDRIDLALLVGADGVHLGRTSVSIADARRLLGPAALVSVACHAPAEVVVAARLGATCCTLSPIFASPGKDAPLGVEAIGEARRLLAQAGLTIGLVALGGIDADTAKDALAEGADGVAAIRAEIPAAVFSRRTTSDPSSGGRP